MSKTVILDLHYLPSIEYFCCIGMYDHIILEAHEHFQKQTYRNRCKISSANKVDTLSIPVKHGSKKVPITEVEIDYNQKWNSNHWRAIQSAYGKAPFFEYFADYFEKVFQKKENFLFEHNYQLLTICLSLLGLNKKISLSERYEKAINCNIEDFRSYIHPKVDYNYRQIFMPKVYFQTFGKDFVPNLSIIDLLMCEGPNSSHIVAQSTRKE